MATDRVPLPVFITVGHHAPLLRVKGCRPTVVWICGSMRSYYVHWVPSILRTQPCLADGCPYCEEHLPRRPLAYFPCFNWRVYGEHIGWVRSVLEVPLRAGLLVEKLQARGLSLQRKSSCGLVQVNPTPVRSTPDDTASWDITPQLLQLWRLPRTVPLAEVTAQFE